MFTKQLKNKFDLNVVVVFQTFERHNIKSLQFKILNSNMKYSLIQLRSFRETIIKLSLAFSHLENILQQIYNFLVFFFAT